MGRQRRYTDKQIIEAVKNSGSIRQVLIKLDLAEAGGNYSSIKKKFRELQLDTSHFHGQGWNKGLKVNFNSTQSIREILVKNSDFQTSHLRQRLIREGIKEYKCERCSRKKWMGYKIPLTLHHINRDNCDNRIENLLVLCANCHRVEHMGQYSI